MLHFQKCLINEFLSYYMQLFFLAPQVSVFIVIICRFDLSIDFPDKIRTILDRTNSLNHLFSLRRARRKRKDKQASSHPNSGTNTFFRAINNQLFQGRGKSKGRRNREKSTARILRRQDERCDYSRG